MPRKCWRCWQGFEVEMEGEGGSLLRGCLGGCCCGVDAVMFVTFVYGF